MRERIEGRSAAAGTAVGPVFLIEDVVVKTTTSTVPETEKQRLHEAFDSSVARLERLAASASEDLADQGEIFEAQAMFIQDPELVSAAESGVDEGATAEAAAADALDNLAEALSALEDDYLSARAGDIGDIKQLVLGILTGAEEQIPEVPSVIVASDVTPTQTVSIPRERILGIVCAQGSELSHAAILARTLGIPAVVGASGITDVVETGLTVAVDGDTGVVDVDPGPTIVADFEGRATRAAEKRERLARLSGLAAETKDGHTVTLAANIDAPEALETAVEAGAQGSGLVRTEFLFQDRDQPPSVEEQANAYSQVLETFPDHLVVIRTLDIGADKSVPFLEQRNEQNPALGVRGLRLGFDQPDLLDTQLRALARVADRGRLAVMFPMVSQVEEFIRARDRFRAIADTDGQDVSEVQVGTMIEVPAAALAATEIAAEADFLSIGTNDLLQYVYAADRTVGEVASLPSLHRPEMLRLISSIVSAAHESDIWVGVCGETAGDPVTGLVLVALGVDELSASPLRLPAVKDAIRSTDTEALAAVLEKAMQGNGESVFRELLGDAYAGPPPNAL